MLFTLSPRLPIFWITVSFQHLKHHQNAKTDIIEERLALGVYLAEDKVQSSTFRQPLFHISDAVFPHLLYHIGPQYAQKWVSFNTLGDTFHAVCDGKHLLSRFARGAPQSSVDAFLTWSRSTATSRQFFVCLQMSSFTIKAQQYVHGRKSSTGFSWLGRLSTMILSPVVRASILCLKLPLF